MVDDRKQTIGTWAEILAMDTKAASCAFYYAVASPLPSADDQSRTPQGSGLTPAQDQQLKDGTLHEFVRSVAVNGMTVEQAERRVEDSYGEFYDAAQKDYQGTYQTAEKVGKVWDGSNWSG